jgi:hypothetical protein
VLLHGEKVVEGSLPLLSWVFYLFNALLFRLYKAQLCYIDLVSRRDSENPNLKKPYQIRGGEPKVSLKVCCFICVVAL